MDNNQSKRLRWAVRVFNIVNKLTKLILFIYSFRYLISPSFAFYKPYYHSFGYLIRRLNSFEADQENKKPLIQRLFSQYNIFLLFMFKTYCEWHFGARLQAQ